MPFPSLARPLLPSGSAPSPPAKGRVITTLPSPPSLILADGRFDRRAIMRAAHAEAREKQASAIARGVAPWPYALRLKHALHHVWGDARVHAHCAREDARLAAMSPEVASLIRERALALHIDSLLAMTAELAAIDARAAAVGVRL